ncbi:MAG: cupin domain-containing protein [Oceanicaulis sp.]
MTSFTLAALLAPHPVDRFFETIYERAHLHVRGTDPDRFAGLISTARIDALVSGQVFAGDQLSMARSGGGKIAPGDYLTDGLADPGLVARRYQEGATLILPQLHRRERPLADLCRALEAELSHPVQTNIYLTPPTAKGFETHFDNHDVFVLQVEGRKRWRLYGAPAGTPYRGERFTPGGYAPGDLAAELVLEPGDVIYVPRGIMHDAVNENADGPSLHVTTGVLARTWADWLLEAVGEAALKSPALRRALPPGFHDGRVPSAVFETAFAEALDHVRRNADLEAVTALFCDRFTETRTADVSGAILRGPEAGDAAIALRPGLPCRLAEDGDHVALLAPGGPLQFDRAAEPALERLLAGETLGRSDFAAMGEDKARDAVARLVAFGAARIVPER